MKKEKHANLPNIREDVVEESIDSINCKNNPIQNQDIGSSLIDDNNNIEEMDYMNKNFKEIDERLGITRKPLIPAKFIFRDEDKSSPKQ